MKDRIDQLKEQLLGVWQNFGRGQKMSIVVIALLAIGSAAGLMIWSQMPDYTTLYSGLNEEDAGAITAKLKESKADYQLADGGTTVLVPAAQVAQTRLDLAAEGIPKGGTTGFELFDETSFGMTDFTQRLNYQRALEGELTRTIGQLSAVEQARVHLAIPEESLYSDEQKEPTASVVLKLRSGSELSKKQVKGISHLVAASVEGLKPENLTIVDTNGNILSDGASSDGMDFELTASQMELQSQFEKSTARSVQALLDRVLGPSKAAVRVSAQLNWDYFEANNELYNPGDSKSQIVSSHSITETSSANGGVAAGVPGVDANVPGYEQTGAEAGASGYGRQETTNNYEVSKSIEKIVRAPGSIEKMSVAVILDSDATAAQVSDLEKAISAAVGVDSVRGDTLTITSMPFDKTFTEEQEKAMADAEREQLIFDAARIAGMVIVPILVLVFLRFLFKPKEGKKGKKDDANAVADVARRMAIPGGRQPQMVEAMVPPEQLLIEGQRRRMIQSQVNGLAKQQPAAVAQVIQTWLTEDEEKR